MRLGSTSPRQNSSFKNTEETKNKDDNLSSQAAPKGNSEVKEQSVSRLPSQGAAEETNALFRSQLGIPSHSGNTKSESSEITKTLKTLANSNDITYMYQTSKGDGVIRKKGGIVPDEPTGSNKRIDSDHNLRNTDFGKWANNHNPDPLPGNYNMNCMEVILYAAEKNGLLAHSDLTAHYQDHVQDIGKWMKETICPNRTPLEFTIQEDSASIIGSPNIKEGDILVFFHRPESATPEQKQFDRHWCVCSGTDANGDIEVISHDGVDDANAPRILKLTDLILESKEHKPYIEFGTPNWPKEKPSVSDRYETLKEEYKFTPQTLADGSEKHIIAFLERDVTLFETLHKEFENIPDSSSSLNQIYKELLDKVNEELKLITGNVDLETNLFASKEVEVITKLDTILSGISLQIDENSSSVLKENGDLRTNLEGRFSTQSHVVTVQFDGNPENLKRMKSKFSEKKSSLQYKQFKIKNSQSPDRILTFDQFESMLNDR